MKALQAGASRTFDIGQGVVDEHRFFGPETVSVEQAMEDRCVRFEHPDIAGDDFSIQQGEDRIVFLDPVERFGRPVGQAVDAVSGSLVVRHQLVHARYGGAHHLFPLIPVYIDFTRPFGVLRCEFGEPFSEGLSSIELPVPVVGTDMVEKPLGLFG